MSQKDQEAAIDEKIERIRRKNEEIKRRYLEVEADKLNAEKLNASVKFTPSETKNTERKSFSRPPSDNRNPRVEKKLPDKPYTANFPSHGKKFANFTDGDGPPPDPVYTFLSDHSRDQPRGDYSPTAKSTRENTVDDEFRGQRGRGRGRGWNRGRGGPMRGNRRGGNASNQFSRQGPQLQPEYQAWRAEREKIDQDRITRQKTAEGNWRREWDSEKLSQDENQEFQTRPSFSKKKKGRDIEDMKIQRTVTNELATASPSKETESRRSDKSSVKSDYHTKVMPVDKKSVAFSFSEGASCNETNDDDLQEHLGFEHRNIISCGDSIKISLSNKPIRSVRVNPVNAAGTGRVGPRQKPLLSYSSQSEDEKEIHIYHKRVHTHTFGPKEAALLPPRAVASSRKPPLPPCQGFSREFGSPKKKPAATKVQPTVSKEAESPLAERKELSRESSHENVSEGGDDSWEDVATTSGNESADCSDADVAKKSDSSDKSIPREENLDDGSAEAASKIEEAVNRECGELGERDEAEQEELHWQTDGIDDEIDKEAEVRLSEENYESVEEDIYSGVDVEAYEAHDGSSLETGNFGNKELYHEGTKSVNKVESPHKEKVAQVTREESESPGEGVSPSVEEGMSRGEEGGKENVLSARVETPKSHVENAVLTIGEDLVAIPQESHIDKEEADLGNTLSVESGADQLPSHIPSDLPESLQKKDGTQDLKGVGAEGSSQMIHNEATIFRSMDKEMSLPESKANGSDSTSLKNIASSPAI